MNSKGLLIWILGIIFISSVKGQVNIAFADSLIEKEQFEEAISIYKAINEQFLEQQKFRDYLSTSIIIAENLDYTRQSKTAVDYLEKAIENTQSKLGRDSLIASVLHKLALIHYNSFNDDDSAIENWQKALSIRTEVLVPNHLDIIKGYRNLGQGYLNKQQLEKARINFHKAEDLLTSKLNPNALLKAKTFNDLGWVYTVLEDFSKADNYFKIAQNDFLQLFAEEPWNLYEIYGNIGNFYLLQEKYNNLIRSQKEFLNLYKSVEEKWEDDYIYLATTHNNLGMGYELIDSSSKAEYHIKMAISINEKHVIENDKYLAINYNNLGSIYAAKGLFLKAQDAINQAIRYDEKIKNFSGQAINYEEKSRIFLLADDGKSAEKAINKALQIIISSEQSNLKNDKILKISLLDSKLKVYKFLSLYDKQYLQGATNVIKEISSLINEIRITYKTDSSKSFLAKKAKDIIKNGIYTYVELYQETNNKNYLNNAFDLVEQSKSIILMDALQRAAVNRTTDVPARILDKETNLKHQINKIEKEIFLNSEDENLNEELVQTQRALDKLSDSLKINYSKYYNARNNTSIPTINQIQNSIDGNLIEYFVGDSTIYAFKITKDQANIDYVEIPLDFPLTNWIKQLREGIYQPHLQKLRSDEEEAKYAQDLVNIAHQLHQKLIAPILKSTQKEEQLIIIPDGILGYIPFDVLITKEPEDATLFGAHDYLINDFQISYAYSATSLVEMQKKEFSKSTSNNFTAFAPTFEGEEAAAFVRSIDDIRGELSPLEYNIPEVESIQQLIGGKLFTGLAATRASFIQNAANSKIVHLATHGKANDEKGDYAFLAFTDTKDSIDFKLYNRDLYNLELNADMVVLSACETGIGELQKGEGIISLARGFTYAGAKSIVTTLWSINDNRTKEIMENFYGNLKAGQAKDAALRHAKLSFIADYGHNAHPFFWAAFIPIGDMEAIELGSNWDWKFGLIGVVGLLMFLLWRRRKTD